MPTKRVRYREKQRLLVADLQDEQQYLINIVRRHSLGAHSPGIAQSVRIVLDSLGAPVVQAGFAIDGAGRQLVLSRPEPLRAQLPIGGSADVWLISCTDPVRLRRSGREDCSPETFQRWRESARVRVVPSDSDAPDPAGVFVGRITHSDAAETRFQIDSSVVVPHISSQGSALQNPAARALLQVGPGTAFDRNSVLLSVADSTGAKHRRLAVDRDGNVVTWGNAELSEYRARLLVPLGKEKLFLLVEAKTPGPMGERITVSKEPGKPIDERTSLTIGFSDFATGRKELLHDLDYGAERSMVEKQLSHFNHDQQLVRLSTISADAPEAGTIARMPAQDDRGIPLTTAGGDLLLADFPAAAQRVPAELRGCQEASVDHERTNSQFLNGLSFLPLIEPLKSPVSRRIYSAAVAADVGQTEDIRFDLGEKKKEDESTRLSIGAWAETAKSFGSWLRVSGNCTVSIGHVGSEPESPPPKTPPDKLPVSIRTTGSVEQAPIKPDPSDPLFKNLLIAAWLNGLRSATLATHIVELALASLPVLIETDKDWSYTVRLKNTGTDPVTIDKLLETRSIAGRLLLHSVAVSVTLARQTDQAFPISHRAGEMDPGDLNLEVTASGKIGKVTWWTSVALAPIPVVKSPSINFMDLPDSVPAGSGWSHSVTFQNPAARDLTVEEVHLVESNGGGVQSAVPEELTRGQSKVIGPVLHPNGISTDLTVDLSVKYRWKEGPEVTARKQKVVHVERQLEIKVNVPSSIAANTAWQFTLELKNTSGKAINVTSLEQRLSSTGLPTLAISVLPGSLAPGSTYMSAPIDGIKLPAGAKSVTLEIRATYDRDARPWSTAGSKDVSVA